MLNKNTENKFIGTHLYCHKTLQFLALTRVDIMAIQYHPE
jgi:carbamoylphosphate synthase small subunit